MDIDCETADMGNSLASEASRLVRYGVIAAGGYMIGQCWLQQDTVDMIVAISTTATPIVIGMIIGRMNRKKLVQAVKSKSDSAS